MVLKIFIGLVGVSGYYANLKKGFEDIGLECTNVSLYHDSIGDDDIPNVWVKLCKWNIEQRKRYNNRIIKAIYIIVSESLKIPIFIWALNRYNVFILGFGVSFFNYFGRYWDLPIFKLFNKKLIFTFVGSDGRPPYMNGSRDYAKLEDHERLNLCKRSSQRIKSNIIAIEKFADHIITGPAYAHFHQKKIVKILSIGFPMNQLPYNDLKSNELKSDIRILHAPSDSVGKGTERIRAAIAELKLKGYNINYVELTGKPHHEVIKELIACDFIVDQVFGSLMGGFATEAAWFGKPTVVGGYYANYICNDYSLQHIPPSLYCHPDEITCSIERLIVDEEYRIDLGRRAQEFVRTQWTPEKVARRYLQIIEGTIPDEFMFDPNTIRYVQGYGMPESKSKEIIHKMIEQYGIESLCLSDKPELEKIIKNYAFDKAKINKKYPLKIED
jgi:glycosyltransferase involved in cell wall biosynthesis